jgi:hypothetical protein
MTDVFEYPYPLEFDAAGDASRITANFTAIAAHINNNLQASKTFVLKSPLVLQASAKMLSDGTAMTLLSVEVPVFGEMVQQSVWLWVSGNPQLTGQLEIRNSSGAVVGSKWLDGSSACKTPLRLQLEILGGKNHVAGTLLNLYTTGLTRVSGGPSIDGLCVAMTCVLKAEVVA